MAALSLNDVVRSHVGQGGLAEATTVLRQARMAFPAISPLAAAFQVMTTGTALPVLQQRACSLLVASPWATRVLDESALVDRAAGATPTAGSRAHALDECVAGIETWNGETLGPVLDAIVLADGLIPIDLALERKLGLTNANPDMAQARFNQMAAGCAATFQEIKDQPGRLFRYIKQSHANTVVTAALRKQLDRTIAIPEKKRSLGNTLGIWMIIFAALQKHERLLSSDLETVRLPFSVADHLTLRCGPKGWPDSSFPSAMIAAAIAMRMGAEIRVIASVDDVFVVDTHAKILIQFADDCVVMGTVAEAYATGQLGERQALLPVWSLLVDLFNNAADPERAADPQQRLRWMELQHKIAPGHLPSMINLALYYQSTGHLQSAEWHLRNARTMNAHAWLPHLALLRLYQDTEKWAEAVASGIAAIEAMEKNLSDGITAEPSLTNYANFLEPQHLFEARTRVAEIYLRELQQPHEALQQLAAMGQIIQKALSVDMEGEVFRALPHELIVRLLGLIADMEPHIPAHFDLSWARNLRLVPPEEDAD